MKSRLLLKTFSVVGLIFFAFASNAQTGHDIGISLKPYKNEYVYLGYYYGKMKALADSCMLNDASEGSFKGPETLPGGIYFVVSPHKEILFEVLVDKDQFFTIKADTAELPKVTYTGSADNTRFLEYSQFAAEKGQAMNRLSALYKNAKTARDSSQINAKSKQLSDQLQSYRDSLVKKDRESFLSALFNAMRDPHVPSASQQPGGKYDSNFAYQYYKSHYWDGVSFTDDRLVRTPFFEPRLDKYYKDVVVPQPDSLIKEIDAMLLASRSATEMYKYLMVYFVQKYINPQYMGQDAVFVHLFEKYINTGQATFFTDRYREFIDKRAYSLMANLIGSQAANMEMVDTLEKARPLYGVQADYTVVVFWDPTCGHCKEVVPKVDSIYQAKWKKQGVQVYGVKVDGSREEWLNFIHQHNLKDWIHVYQQPAQQEAEAQAKRPNFRQLYDVYQTPILYLLDKDKRIVAKKLTYLQINDVIDLKKKNPK